MKKPAYFVNLLLLLLTIGTGRLFSLSPELTSKLETLNSRLEEMGIPSTWLEENVNDSKFKVYYNIEKIFHNMAENKVKRQEKDFNWYKNHFGLDIKVKNGLEFIKANKELLKKVEAKNGIHYELITAIIGIETNFADPGQRGTYYTFNALVSQYLLIPSREKFALNQLKALYEFSSLTYKSNYYFIGSFAGACGWAQFIPTSLLNYFVDADDNYPGLDIYALDDTLFSIDNYLFHHGLNRRNIADEKALYKAVYSYNHSDAYVKAVLYMYNAFKKAGTTASQE